MVVHQHSVIDAVVARLPEHTTCAEMRAFLADLVDAIGMQRLFDPIAIDGKYGFTGIVGIVTSHIAFHYFEEDRSLHFDVYSCKAYELEKVMRHIDEFWQVEDASIVVVDRSDTTAVRYSYKGNTLLKETEDESKDSRSRL